MDQEVINNYGEQSSYADLAASYSEACQSFVLRDFDNTSSIVNGLLQDIEQDSLGLSDEDSASDISELVRRVWILHITLLASADEELARDSRKAEQALSRTLNRIEQFYARHSIQGELPSSIASSSASTASSTLIHPSILVAFSLAGLKLETPQLIRRTLQDYFQLLLSRAAESESHLSSSQGDISTLDASQADLSLSGIAVNGHHLSNNHVNGHPANNANGARSDQISASRIKSLHRLARIYSVHLLGKTLGEWSTARAWIRERQHDEAGVSAGLMSEPYAQTLLETLDEAKLESEQEEVEAKRAAKADKERQAAAAKKGRTESRRQQERSTSPAAASSQAGKPRPSSSSSHASTQKKPTASSATNERISSQYERASEAGRSISQNSTSETGFSAFRSHLSTFLSSDPSSSSSNSISRRQQTHDRLSHSDSNTSTFDILKLYLSRMINSRSLKVLLAFFIITGFWRRRLARSGRKIEIGETWRKLKEKVVDTVKMGGSLGFL